MVAIRVAKRLDMKHIRLDNAIYHVTTVVYGRLAMFTKPSFVIPLLDSMNYYRHKLHFLLMGYVIMPDHLHFLVWPQGTSDLSGIMRDYKKFTATRVIRQVEVEQRTDWMAAIKEAGETTGRSEHKLWQDDYFDTLVFSPRVLREKLNYIHRNPVRAGLVESPEQYPYSSYRNYVCDDESLIEIDREWVSW